MTPFTIQAYLTGIQNRLLEAEWYDLIIHLEFAPTEILINELREAGASDSFIFANVSYKWSAA